jgi:hypothetical protein
VAACRKSPVDEVPFSRLTAKRPDRGHDHAGCAVRSEVPRNEPQGAQGTPSMTLEEPPVPPDTVPRALVSAQPSRTLPTLPVRAKTQKSRLTLHQLATPIWLPAARPLMHDQQ